VSLAGLDLESLATHGGGAPFDLTLHAALLPDGRLGLSLEYATDLFDADTAGRLLGHYRTLLGGAVEAPASRVSGLPLLDPTERRRVLVEWAGLPCGPPADPVCAIHERFERQARLTPDAPALVAAGERLTYAEL